MKRLTLIFIFAVVIIALFLLNCERSTPKVTTASTEALALYNEGVKLAEKFKTFEAIEKFKAAIDLDTTFAMAYYYLSRSYESAGNLSQAKANLKKAIQFSGLTTPLEWMYVGAWEKVLENDYTGAIQKYQQILDEYPNDRHALFVIGKTYRLAKKYPESIDALKKLIKKYPQYAPAYNQLGYTYYEIGDYKQATAMFSRYAKLEPDEPNPYDSLGDMYRAQGNYQKAIELYKKALEIKPDFYTSFRNLGWAYFSTGKYDSAIATYQKFLQVVTDRELKRDANSDLVDIYLAMGQYRKAMDYIQKVIDLSVTPFRKSWAIAKKGYIYYLQDNLPAALQQLNRSMTIYPEAIWAREWRGLVLLKQKKYDAVLSEAEKMKTLIDKYGTKGYQCSYNNLLGRTAMEQGLYDEAIMYFKDSMQLEPASCRYPLAIAYFKKGDYQQAIALCQQLLSHNKNHAFAHLLLAQVYEKLGDRNKMTTEYRKFLDVWKNADHGLPELKLANQALK